MPAELDREQLQRLARLGARARLAELEAERRAILHAFPDLGAVPGKAAKATPAAGARVQPSASAGRSVRRRRKRTAAERKAASERMKQIWADRRKHQA